MKKLPKLFVPSTKPINNNMKKFNSNSHIKKELADFQIDDYFEKDFEEDFEEDFEVTEELEPEKSSHFIDMDIKDKIGYVLNIPRYVNFEVVLSIADDVVIGKLLETSSNEILVLTDDQRVSYNVADIKDIKLL